MEVQFALLEKITITKENKGYTANSRSRDRQVKWNQYNANLIFDSYNSLILFSADNINTLINKIRTLKEFLDIEIEDQTTAVHFNISIQ